MTDNEHNDDKDRAQGTWPCIFLFLNRMVGTVCMWTFFTVLLLLVFKKCGWTTLP